VGGPRDVCGPHLRAALRASLRQLRPLVVIVDARGHDAVADRLAFTVRLRRLARRGGGDVILIVDENLRRKLRSTGLEPWLSVAVSESEALSVAASLDRAPQLVRHESSVGG
jgi:hypothetical protein